MTEADMLNHLETLHQEASWDLHDMLRRVSPGPRRVDGGNLFLIAVEDAAPRFETDEPDRGPGALTGRLLLAYARNGDRNDSVAKAIAPPDRAADDVQQRWEQLASCSAYELRDLLVDVFCEGRVGLISEDYELLFDRDEDRWYFTFALLALTGEMADRVGGPSFSRCALTCWLDAVTRSAAVEPDYPFRNMLWANPDEITLRAAQRFVGELVVPEDMAGPSLARFFEASVFTSLTAISMETYEKAEASGRLAVFRREPARIDMRLVHPVRLSNVRRVRKLLHGTQATLSLVFYNDEIIGFRSRADDDPGLVASILFRPRGVWELTGPDAKPLLRVIRGRPEAPQPGAHLEVEQKLERRLAEFPAPARSEVVEAIRRILECRQGALFVFTSHAESEVGAGDSTGRLGQQSTRIHPRPANAEHLVEVSRADGAVFLDLAGRIHGFGVILDGIVGAAPPTEPSPSSPRQGFLRRTHQRRDDRSLPDPSRGSRYNSAATYVHSRSCTNPPERLCAVVVSEDGGVTVLPTDVEWAEYETRRRPAVAETSLKSSGSDLI